jgi:hypothetical protein
MKMNDGRIISDQKQSVKKEEDAIIYVGPQRGDWDSWQARVSISSGYGIENFSSGPVSSLRLSESPGLAGVGVAANEARFLLA